MELKITKDKVLAAAAKCSTAKVTLETLFPEAFEEDKYFDFGDSRLFTVVSSDNPFYIGRGDAPKELKHKCLVVCRDWDIEVKEYNGRKIIIPTRKTS